MPYFYLAVAICAEVIGTTALKASAEFSKPIPSVIVVIGYATAFYFMALVLRNIPVGITYAIWSGAGIVLITITSAIIYRQIPDTAAMLGMSLIILGVVIIHLFSKNITQ